MSKTTLDNNELMNLLNGTTVNYGHIICKCNLVDCIYMDENFINKIKQNENEYICGNYDLGRYAWILDNIQLLIDPINVNGQLGIWNYYDEYEIMDFMNDIKYGWADKDGTKHESIDETYSTQYRLQSYKDIMKNKVGVCWDQVELERYYFKNSSYNFKTFFLCYYDDNKCPTHTFLTFEKNDKYYWFEHSWEKHKNIHQYNSLKELLLDIKNKFIKDQLNDNCKENNLVLYEYSKPKVHLSVPDFYKHCESGKNITF